MELLISGPEGSPVRVQLQEPSLALGRASDNDLAYPDDPWLSRFHLTFEKRSDGWFITDCASRNGTVVNAATLRETRLLLPGDRIYAGHLTIEVQSEAHENAKPVISFIPQEEERVTREATIVTSLDNLSAIAVAAE